jgi:hypothetical protein
MLRLAVLLPFLYLAVPAALVASAFVVAAPSALDLLLSVLLHSRTSAWLLAGLARGHGNLNEGKN